METDIVHSADFSVHIGDADHLVATKKFFGFVGGRQFGLKCEFDKWHDASGSAEKAGPSLRSGCQIV
jgi:hypothetical protein